MQINIIEYLENTVKSVPDKTAIHDAGRKITFNELSARSKALAVKILDTEGILNQPVAVYLPKSIESVMADIAVTYSGNCYMNLDIKTPASRIKSILDVIKPSVIIGNTETLRDIELISDNAPVINVDKVDLNSVTDLEKLHYNMKRIIDTDPLCIINTSGSTGTPKGAVLNHRSYIDFTEWAITTFDFSGDEVLGVLSPIVFDLFNYEICLMMAKGSTLVLLDNSMATFPVKLLETIRNFNVNYIFWVPSILVNIANLDLLSKISLPDLKMVWFAGEVLPTKQFNYWKKWLPSATFVNLYGPVEASVSVTYFIIDRDIPDDQPIPIGFPCRNTDIIVLNELNQLTQVNEEGELCIRGSSLAMGYYHNPDKTQSAFVQNPVNTSYPEIIYRTGDIVFINERGELIFKGRKDSMIKHMGYRIELGEIEHVIINALKLVDNGCVVYNTSKKEITLFYESNAEIPVSVFRKEIARALPKYMIPAAFFKVNELPKNTNGKIDRLSLSKKVNN